MPELYIPLTDIYVLVPVILLWNTWSWHAARKRAQDTNPMRAGAMAQRLGLALVQGDPSYPVGLHGQEPRLSIAGITKDNPLAHVRKDAEIRAKGSSHGRNIEMYYKDKEEADLALPIAGRKVTYTFGCWLSAALQTKVPRFEFVLSDPPAYGEPERVHTELSRRASLGSADLDRTYALFTDDPHVGARLAKALSRFQGMWAVHVVGDQDQVYLKFTREMVHTFAEQAELFLLALASTANALEDRPLP